MDHPAPQTVRRKPQTMNHTHLFKLLWGVAHIKSLIDISRGPETQPSSPIFWPTNYPKNPLNVKSACWPQVRPRAALKWALMSFGVGDRNPLIPTPFSAYLSLFFPFFWGLGGQPRETEFKAWGSMRREALVSGVVTCLGLSLREVPRWKSYTFGKVIADYDRKYRTLKPQNRFGSRNSSDSDGPVTEIRWEAWELLLAQRLPVCSTHDLSPQSPRLMQPKAA